MSAPVPLASRLGAEAPQAAQSATAQVVQPTQLVQSAQPAQPGRTAQAAEPVQPPQSAALPVLSVIVPCYNSAAYMERCVNSLLLGGSRLEVIIVDDGSSDQTAAIADRYAREFPWGIRVIHQPNGGPGIAIDSGLQAARGSYVKVVDSDDWLGTAELSQVLDFLQQQAPKAHLDLLVCNFVYEKLGKRHKKSEGYARFMPSDRVFSWDEIHFPLTKFMLMHSLIYRTELLRAAQLDLPAHTFYVDEIYASKPLAQVKRIFYLNVDLYHYFIGRPDQSINEKVMIGRIDQQLLVNTIMIDNYARCFPQESATIGVSTYLAHYITIVVGVSSILLMRDGSRAALAKKAGLWDYLYRSHRRLWLKARMSPIGVICNLPGLLGRKLGVLLYLVLRAFYGFN